MKRAIPFLTALALLILIALGYAGYRLIEKYTPSAEMADLTEVYGASGNEVALIYNYELQETQGIFENGQYYLPISWINSNVDKRFYWDSTEDLLVYALPDQIVSADITTAGSNGTPLLLERDDDIYLTIGLIANYSDVQVTSYNSGGVNRVYLTDWGTRQVSYLKKDAKVREKGGIKSAIIAEEKKRSQVTVLEPMDRWSLVMTASGHMGYIENRCLYTAMAEEFESTKAQPVYGWSGLEEKLVLAWHQVTSQAGNSTLESLLAQTKGVNVVSPTWFSLTDNSGNFSSLASQDYVDLAHEKGLQVWALLDNFSSDVKTEVLLASTSNRRKLIDGLIGEAEKYGIDGLNMDFESLKPEAGPHYIQFLRELSIPCRQKGIILSVDNYVPTEYNSFYDRAEQAIVADYVIVMGYDEHYAGGERGSVSSLSFVDRGIQKTLESVPKERVICGVPFYTRLWTETSDGEMSKALGIREAKAWVDENQVELTWLEDEGQYYGEYESGDRIQRVWLEEEESLSLKMNLIRTYDLGGVACWKLGLEDAAAWDAIDWESDLGQEAITVEGSGGRRLTAASGTACA